MNEQYFYHFRIFIIKSTLIIDYTAWKVSKYGVISDPYFPAANLKTGKYGPEIAPYLDTFHAVLLILLNKILVLPVFLHSRY